MFLLSPKFYVQEKSGGVLVSGGRFGFPSPNYLEFSKIYCVAVQDHGVNITLSDGSLVEVYIPSGKKEDFALFLNEKISR